MNSLGLCGERSLILGIVSNHNRCCDYGRGSFVVMVKDGGSWKELVRGGQFKGSKVIRTFDLGNIDGDSGGDETSASRDQEWLVAHNVRRKQWHEEYG